MKGNITISRPNYGDGRKKITIQVKDTEAVNRFLDIEIDYDKFAQLITGLSEVECDFTVRNLEQVGKIREIKEIEFPIGDIGYDDRTEILSELAKKYIPDGWKCDNYFSSQNSVFSKDGVDYARVNIKRWI